MAALDSLINVVVTQSTQAVSQESFSVPLIIGKSNPGWTDRVHVYSGPDAMLNDGFTDASPEYLAAQSMFSQTITPTVFLVGLRTSDTVANDLAAIIAENNTWYGCMLSEPSDADIEAMAAAIEPLKKIFISSTSTAAVAQSGSTDFASVMGKAGYERTALIYTQNANGIAEAAWLGSQLPQVPGTNDWAYTTLKGVTPDSLSDNQRAVLYGVPVAGIAGKNVNTYSVLGSNTAVTLLGQMIGGQWIDIVIGLDWLRSRIISGIYEQVASAGKVPYTDAGAAMLMLPVSNVLQEAAANQLLDGNDADYPLRVTCDKVSAVPKSQRANRIGPTIRFQARLQGSVCSIAVSGTVTV